MTTKKPEATKQPEELQFSLKDIELRMIQNINQRNNQELVDFLSFIALERLAIEVTEYTQFRVDGEGNLYVSERPAPEEPKTEEEVAVA